MVRGLVLVNAREAGTAEPRRYPVRSTTSPPTVRDVAARAGVSPGTVSKALNGTGQLSEATRSRVTAAAEELGFRERHYVQELLNRRVDGLVVTGRRPDPRPSLGPLPIPVVYVLVQSDDPQDLSLSYDDVQGARLGVEHLLANGRKRFAYVSGPARHWSTQRRREGVQLELASAGLELEPEMVLLGQWSEAWGRTAAGQLLRQDARVDAVVCGSDQIARGVADGLREAGASVPGQVAVVGFDNWDVMVEAARPPLTTIDPNLTSLGRLAASRLMSAIDGAELGHGVVLQPCDLVLRQSSFS
jgi:LacI family transcriptional regulator